MMFKKIKAFFELVKFEHSIFALPFAYLGLFIAEGGFPRVRLFFWVTVAMVALRTAAMCLNRLIDQPIDEKNPRTVARIRLIHLIRRTRIWMITFASLLIFVFSAAQLNRLCLVLTPIPIVLIYLYPFLKKITWLSHFILGIILGGAPVAGWLASRTEWSFVPVLLCLAVATWVSGFDMVYALQDVVFDREHGLKSFPARFGHERTMKMVIFLHGITLAALASFGIFYGMKIWYWMGWMLAAALMTREHGLVRRFGLSKMNEAFFNMNASVSIVLFIAVALDLTMR